MLQAVRRKMNKRKKYGMGLQGSQAATKKRFAYSAWAAVLSGLDDVFSYYEERPRKGTESRRQKLL